MIQLQHLRVSTPKQVENVSIEFFFSPPWVNFLWSDEGDDDASTSETQTEVQDTNLSGSQCLSSCFAPRLSGTVLSHKGPGEAPATQTGHLKTSPQENPLQHQQIQRQSWSLNGPRPRYERY